MAAREELLAASDETIADALLYADPMVLRGLLYQLTGDSEVAAIEAQPLGEGSAYNAAGGVRLVADKTDIATLRAKALALLKAYREAGAG